MAGWNGHDGAMSPDIVGLACLLRQLPREVSFAVLEDLVRRLGYPVVVVQLPRGFPIERLGDLADHVQGLVRSFEEGLLDELDELDERDAGDGRDDAGAA